MPPRTVDMKRLITAVNRWFAPTLYLSYTALCLILLGVVPDGKIGLLFALLWAILTAAVLRWGVWGILKSARKHTDVGEWKILLRVTEALLLLLTIAALVFAILLPEIPAVWLFFPLPLFGLRGALAWEE